MLRKVPVFNQTASIVGNIFTRQRNNKLAPLIKSVIHSPFKGNANTRYGLAHENNTVFEYDLQQVSKGVNVKVKRCGLVIHPEHPFLAATPDVIVTCNGVDIGLIEVKNVLRNKRKNLDQAARDKGFCLEFVDDNLQLKRKHAYYYQCQGQLLVCEMDWVDFVVRCTDPYQMFVERITVNNDVQCHMLAKLKAFYFKALLPELTAPRYGKLPGIREPGPDWVHIL
jgi:hypothetical protein